MKAVSRLRRALFRTPGARFDRRNNVETDAVIDLDSVAVEGDPDRGFLHVPTPPRLAAAWLDRVPHAGFTFIDLGSGLGRVLLLASERPFDRIVGVEFAAELHEKALDNIRRYPRTRMRCTRVESIHRDAASFEFPDEPFVVFFHNPFTSQVMAEVIASMENSYLARPRPVYAIYQQLTDEPDEQRTANIDILSRAGFLSGGDIEYTRKDQPVLGHYRVAIFRSAEAV